MLMRAAERGLDGKALRRLGRAAKRDDWVAAGAFLDRYAARFDLAPGARLRLRGDRPDRGGAVVPGGDTCPRASRLRRDVRRRVPGQRSGAGVACCWPWPATGGTSSRSAILTSRSTGFAARTCGRWRASRRSSARRMAARHRWSPCAPAGAAARSCWPHLAGWPVACRLPPAAATPLSASRHDETAPFADIPHRALIPVPGGTPGEVRILIADTATQEAALVADTLRRAHLADGVPVAQDGGPGPLGPAAGPVAAARPRGGGRPGEHCRR